MDTRATRPCPLCAILSAQFDPSTLHPALRQVYDAAAAVVHAGDGPMWRQSLERLKWARTVAGAAGFDEASISAAAIYGNSAATREVRRG